MAGPIIHWSCTQRERRNGLLSNSNRPGGRGGHTGRGLTPSAIEFSDRSVAISRNALVSCMCLGDRGRLMKHHQPTAIPIHENIRSIIVAAAYFA